MLETLSAFSGKIAVLLAGIAVGAAWIIAIAAPNCSYDRLDASRADGHVRKLIHDTSTAIAGILLAAMALSLLGQQLVSAILFALAAFGFFTNRWTLSPKKAGDAPKGVRTSNKSKRVVAVSLTLMFTACVAIGGVLAVLGY